MSMAQLSLDVNMKQCLIDFDDDTSGLIWHHRLLLVTGDTPGLWVASTPTMSIQVIDLKDHRVIPLGRKAAFPASVAGMLFCFDPLSEDQLDLLRREATALAGMMGFTTVTIDESRSGSWYVADPSSELFGLPVPDAALLALDASVVRQSKGLVKIDDQWEFMERVDPRAINEWKLTMRTGPGRDRRIACDVVSNGTRFVTEALAIGFWVSKADDVSKVIGQHLQGPAAGREFFLQLVHSGLTIAQYHVQWRSRSGVPEGGMAARIHCTLTEILRLRITVDQLDPTQLVGAECAVRELLRLEAAVNRNPRQPDFDGLEVMVSSCLNAKGSLETPAFSAWVATTQKEQAMMMKQQRLLREERTAEARQRKGDNQPQNNKGKDKQK